MKEEYPFFKVYRELYRTSLEERERVREAESKPPAERTEQDWIYINYSPYGAGQGCGC